MFYKKTQRIAMVVAMLSSTYVALAGEEEFFKGEVNRALLHGNSVDAEILDSCAKGYQRSIQPGSYAAEQKTVGLMGELLRSGDATLVGLFYTLLNEHKTTLGQSSQGQLILEASEKLQSFTHDLVSGTGLAKSVRWAKPEDAWSLHRAFATLLIEQESLFKSKLPIPADVFTTMLSDNLWNYFKSITPDWVWKVFSSPWLGTGAEEADRIVNVLKTSTANSVTPRHIMWSNLWKARPITREVNMLWGSPLTKWGLLMIEAGTGILESVACLSRGENMTADEVINYATDLLQEHLGNQFCKPQSQFVSPESHNPIYRQIPELRVVKMNGSLRSSILNTTTKVTTLEGHSVSNLGEEMSHSLVFLSFVGSEHDLAPKPKKGRAFDVDVEMGSESPSLIGTRYAQTVHALYERMLRLLCEPVVFQEFGSDEYFSEKDKMISGKKPCALPERVAAASEIVDILKQFKQQPDSEEIDQRLNTTLAEKEASIARRMTELNA